MAADSDGGCILTTVVTCEGNLEDPGFSKRFEQVVGELNGILGEAVKVHKLEPWNSVRVTLSIPREAALRLRKLASEGSAQLRALGILSVQVENDQVISLRIASGPVSAEPQEIVLRTTEDGGESSNSGSSNHRQEADGALSRFLSGGLAGSSSGVGNSTSNETSEKVQFKSPNVVAPPDSVVPKVPASPSGATTPPTSKAYAGPFPFASMNQAIHSREGNNSTYTTPPPPYPGKPSTPSPTVTLSSPLLVNLLQNDGVPQKPAPPKEPPPPPPPPPPTPPASAQVKPAAAAVSPARTVMNSFVSKSVTVQQTISSTAIGGGGGGTVRTVTSNRTMPNAFVQQTHHHHHQTSKPLLSSIVNNPNSLVPRLLNNQEPDGVTTMNTKPFNSTQLPAATAAPSAAPIRQQGPSMISQSQANTSSPSALSNTSSSRQNSKLTNSTTPSLTSSNAIAASHLHYPVVNNMTVGSSLASTNIAKAMGTPPPSAAVGVAPRSVAPPPPPPPPRPLPPPPPYTVAVNRQWDSLVQTSSSASSSPLLDLTPSFTDLKAADLEDLLPTLERDLAGSPLEIPEELTRSSEEDKRNFLINPLTGELEPQSSGESDVEVGLGDVFTGLPSPAALSDDDTNSTIRPDTTDQSDSETRSSHSDSGKHRVKNSKPRTDRGRDSPGGPTEKIKLRLKLEKSEPINNAYKVDVSFIQQQPKKAVVAATPSPSSGEELRVPPLHISLRGRNLAFITNKKKTKLGPDGKPKVRKTQDFASSSGSCSSSGASKPKKSETSAISDELADASPPPPSVIDQQQQQQPRKKKLKTNHESSSSTSSAEMDLKSKLLDFKHFKDKQKERRGSDSELTRTKFSDSNGIIAATIVTAAGTATGICAEKKRRLSQSEAVTEPERPPVLGSTNVGTIAGLPQKSRKDKNKVKDGFKVSKEALRVSKSFSKSSSSSSSTSSMVSDKLVKQVTLPTGEIDMEAKFKQRLMEGSEKGIPRPPHRTETVVVNQVMTENNQIEKAEQVLKVESEPPPLNEKSPDPDKCNTPDRKQTDMGDKQAGRSPNSGAQGEDSGIESMDALSEKSPNQASQSPHADIPEPIKSKTQVPDMLDIEAQLAKMEGLNGVEDLNENQHNSQAKLDQCCELTSALQDSLKQGSVSISVSGNISPVKEQQQQQQQQQLQQADVSLVPIKVKPKDEDLELEPLPVRVTPPLYTYSNPDKGRGSESPGLSDDDSNSGSNLSSNKNKSLLEQLLIEIPDTQTPSSPSPATRSVRTRALSKLSSPELNSPVSTKPTRSATVAAPSATTPASTTKRKRHESDSSGNGHAEPANSDPARNKKPRKCSENAAELIKACMGVEPSKVNNVKKQPPSSIGKMHDESSDSDEPLIEKVRKTNTTNANSVVAPAAVAATPKNKVKSSGGGGGGGGDSGKSVKTVGPVTTAVTTRRSVRTAPSTPNTRSKGDKVSSETEAIRRKTRSAAGGGADARNKKTEEAVAMAEGESKRKKEVK